MKNLTSRQKEKLARFSHLKHLDKLVHDKSWNIRREVACRGTDKRRYILVHDAHLWVKIAVVYHGNEHHARALLNDENEYVKEVARHRLEKLGVE